ncbi:hypothetical protein [Aureimonas mangrovi]|uniref:hypothetical protein n=1 Tax=Aureimonas mangrovi TaxID=2758041 RepID=UPI00163DC022|nr:hypothetical protein [Aureimonas mangrovi]
MKKTLLALAFLSASSAAAFAQDAPAATEAAPAATPTCAEALPQIVQLVDQAEAGGLEVATARDHVGSAEAAQSAGDESGCIDALVMAQNTVIEQLPQQDTPPS